MNDFELAMLLTLAGLCWIQYLIWSYDRSY